jgi:hypothetical protein
MLECGPPVRSVLQGALASPVRLLAGADGRSLLRTICSEFVGVNGVNCRG